MADPGSTRSTSTPSGATPFSSLDDFAALPRISGLALSPDGTRLITGVATLDEKKVAYVTALWEVDPTGERPSRRLTRSAKGESVGAFTPDGDHVFVSARPQPGVDEDDAKPALWLLPAAGGEARLIGTRPGGISGLAVARGSGTVAALSPMLPRSATAEDDEKRRTARKDRKVSALLHESYPIRFWDHDLGPDENRLLIADPPPAEPEAGRDEVRLEWRELTPRPGRALDEAELDLSDDGRRAATTWVVQEPGGNRSAVRVWDTRTGEVLLEVSDPEHEYRGAVLSPDGARLAVRVYERSTADRPPDITLAVATVDGAAGSSTGLRPLAGAWDRWPSGLRWSPDGSRLFVVADEDGAGPVFSVDVASGAVTRLTGDRGAYGELCVSPDGSTLYALRNAVDAAPEVVRLLADAPWQEPVSLPGPAPAPSLPGALEEVTATAADGTPLRAWLAVPDRVWQAPVRPAPLLVWIHGGPLHSWNSWSWRWNPWLAVARGYAVLLPDPALSTGYGLDFVARGWGRWGAEPYTDILALTDAASEHPDVDADRTAAMGGSFGGYMANWIAGHTDRFKGIVSHAGLWALDQFGPTTDAAHFWRREIGPRMAEEWSPHRFRSEIRTPMLVIHGDKDYRVPVGEALRLWAELNESFGDDHGRSPHKLLYFPDENHWILKPQHAVVWYQTVFAFLDHTVHGKSWEIPDILC